MSALPLWLTRVELDSMSPCLAEGQLVWTYRPRRNHRLRRGAVVAVDSAELGHRIVKRIIGLPGEQLRLEGSQVRIDGQLLTEPYATASTYRGTFDVPAGHYLLLGDNRDASSDARTWLHPYVARTEIVGVLLPRCRHQATAGVALRSWPMPKR